MFLLLTHGLFSKPCMLYILKLFLCFIRLVSIIQVMSVSMQSLTLQYSVYRSLHANTVSESDKHLDIEIALHLFQLTIAFNVVVWI